MLFVLSKFAFSLLAPSNFSFALLGGGLVMGFFRTWRRLGQRFAVTGFVLLAVFGFSPVGEWIARPLEDRFAAARLPAAQTVTHIILLGGFEDARLSLSRGQLVTNAASERLLAMLPLARRYPSAKIVFTGGYGALIGQPVDAARQIQDYLVRAGIEDQRILLEGRSRTTWENARYVKQLLAQAQPGCPCGYLLVTSAWHMPRAIGIFRKVGFDAAQGRLYPWPVDYRTPGASESSMPFGWFYDGLRQTDLAVKEWIGLVAYRVVGRTSELWPGPRE